MTSIRKFGWLVLSGIIIAQLTGIYFLGKFIYKNRARVLGTVSVNPINKENIVFSPDSLLTNFFEPTPNEILKQTGPAPFKAAYTINSDSLNERFNYQVEKPPQTLRIITLGDSFTYGLYVNTEDNWPEQLEGILNQKFECRNFEKSEVINLGNVGYDTRYSAERYRIRGQKYNPDMVIWFLFDLRRVSEMLIPLARTYQQQLQKSGELERKIKEGDYYASWNMAEDEVYENLGEDGVLQYQIDSLKEINKYFAGKLLLITLPNGKGYSLSEKQKTAIQKFADSREQTWYFDKITDIYGVEEAIYPNDGHPTKLGHKLFANDIYNILVSKNLIDCE